MFVWQKMVLLSLIISLHAANLLAQAPDTMWTRTYGGTTDDRGYSVQQTADGGYIIAGLTYRGFSDVYLIKTDTSGDTLWTRTYGGESSDEGYSVRQTADGGYIVAGYTRSGYNSPDVYLIKTDASGDTLWTRTYGGIGDDRGYSVELTADGGYIVAGVSIGDLYLIKTDGTGDTLWTRTYGGMRTDEGWSVKQTADGGYVIAGWTYSFGAGGSDVYLIRLDSETGIGDKDNEPMLREFALIRNFPNPFNASTSIRYGLPEQSDVRIEIYNLLGQRVATIYDGLQDAGEHSITWDASGFPSGVYFARLEVGDYSESLKLVLLK